MIKVALAGATTGVGRHIASSILDRGSISLLILSRHDIPDLASKGAEVKIVVYESRSTLTDALLGAHTVISALGDHEKSSNAQLELVYAAKEAGVKRFIPSGWSATDGGDDDEIEWYRFKQPAMQALKESGMQWSHPECGIWMNYFATPKDRTGHLKQLKFWIDVENCKATVPGDGTMKLAYTDVEDVGKFIALSLEYASDQEWPNPLRIVGESISHNEIIQICERVRGQPFAVKHVSEVEYQSQIVQDPPTQRVNLFPRLSIAILQGRFSFVHNSAHLAPMEFTSIDAFLRKWWHE